MHKIFTIYILAICLASCSDSHKGSTNHDPNLTLVITEQNSNEVIRYGLQAISDLRISFAPFIEYEGGFRPFLATDEIHECFDGGNYTADVSVSDIDRPQQTQGDFITYFLNFCDSEYGLFNGTVTRLNQKNQSQSFGDQHWYFDEEFQLFFDEFEYAFGPSDVYEELDKSLLNGTIKVRTAYTEDEDWLSLQLIDLHRYGTDRKREVSEGIYDLIFYSDYEEGVGYTQTTDGEIWIEGMGRFSIQSPSPLAISTGPGSESSYVGGEVIILGEGGGMLRITPLDETDSNFFLIQRDLDGNGVFESEYTILVDFLLR